MKYKKYEAEHVFFTSDTHFNHPAILKFCERPFLDIEEHDNFLVEKWNSIVSDADTVFHLGDFAFGGFPVWERIRPRLNGSICLIQGNHDFHNSSQNNSRLLQMFKDVQWQMHISVEDQPIILTHFPLLCFNGTFNKRPTWNLHGHVHSRKNGIGKDDKRMEQCAFPCQYDVGVDLNNYAPISFRQLQEKMKYQIENNINYYTWINNG